MLTAWDNSTPVARLGGADSEQAGQSLTQRYGLKTSGDDRFVYVYNFPPIDLGDRGRHPDQGRRRITIPGCVLNYPVGKRRFASLCGDGSLLGGDPQRPGPGNRAQPHAVLRPQRGKTGGACSPTSATYYFTTTTGTVRAVDFSGDTPKILPSWSLVTEAEKKTSWAPGGWQLMASRAEAEPFVRADA